MSEKWLDNAGGLFTLFYGEHDIYLEIFAERICKRMRGHDIYVIDDKTPVANVREIFQHLSMQSSKGRLLLIKHMSFITKIIQNTLLKTLESIDKKTIIIGFANRMDNVLKTVKSRARLINARNNTCKETIQFMEQEFGVVKNKEESATDFIERSIFKDLKRCDFDSVSDLADNWSLKGFRVANTDICLMLAKKISKNIVESGRVVDLNDLSRLTDMCKVCEANINIVNSLAVKTFLAVMSEVLQRHQLR